MNGLLVCSVWDFTPDCSVDLLLFSFASARSRLVLLIGSIPRLSQSTHLQMFSRQKACRYLQKFESRLQSSFFVPLFVRSVEAGVVAWLNTQIQPSSAVADVFKAEGLKLSI